MAYTPLQVPDKNLFLLVGDQRRGPFTIEELRTKFAGKEIGRATYLWYPGLMNWVTVGDVPEFDQRETVVPPTTPAAVANEVWIYDRGKVLSVPFERLEKQATEGAFRRADLIYVEQEQKWIRADQHPKLAVLFMPAAPPPAPSAELISGTAVAPEAPPAPPRRPKFGKTLRWAIPLAGISLCAVAGTYFSGVLSSKTRRARPIVQANTVRPATPPTATTPVPTTAPSPGSVPAAVAQAPVEAPAQTQMALPANTPNMARFSVVIPLGMTLEKALEVPSLSGCERNLQEGSGTFNCSKPNPAFEGLKVVFMGGSVNRLEGRFAVNTAPAIAFHGQMQKRFGAPDKETPYACTALSAAQKALFGTYCNTHPIALQHWSAEGVGAKLLIARDKTKDKIIPLEVQVQRNYVPVTPPAGRDVAAAAKEAAPATAAVPPPAETKVEATAPTPAAAPSKAPAANPDVPQPRKPTAKSAKPK
ncbi:DUF4339 domain-containing protein [bacterium]|nr:DUF4339 domain-containing protein [bacterium]